MHIYINSVNSYQENFITRFDVGSEFTLFSSYSPAFSIYYSNVNESVENKNRISLGTQIIQVAFLFSLDINSSSAPVCGVSLSPPSLARRAGELTLCG
jgi:hypothetical protein